MGYLLQTILKRVNPHQQHLVHWSDKAELIGGPSERHWITAFGRLVKLDKTGQCDTDYLVQKVFEVTFRRGSGGKDSLLHPDVLETLYPTSWLMRSHRYSVVRGPCMVAENMARKATGSTVTRRHLTLKKGDRVKQVLGSSGSSGWPLPFSDTPLSFAVSTSRWRIVAVSGSFMSVRLRLQ